MFYKTPITISKIIFFGVFFISLFFFVPNTAHAACSNVPNGGAYTVSASCTFDREVDGSDGGGITVDVGQTLTVGSGPYPEQVIMWAPGESIVINGSIVINDGAELRQGYIYLKDADADGFPQLNVAPTYTETANYRRRYLMDTDWTYYDSNDSSDAIYYGTACDVTSTTTVADSFADSSLIATTSTSTVSGGQVKLKEVAGMKRVFVTDWHEDGDFGGLTVGDSICQSEADAAELGGTWTVWLSSGGINAKDRINDQAYYLVDNTTKVADSLADLIDGSIDHEINMAADGDIISAYSSVWTGTLADGTNSYDCSDWTSNSAGIGTGYRGKLAYSDENWTTYYDYDGCDGYVCLYCFED